MEWFGMTRFGFPDVFKDLMKSDYKEPAVQEEVMEILAKGTTQSFSELASVLDCYIGRIDGYAYKSHDRLVRMRRKGAFKPVGPTDMYNYAGTNAMKFGFWNNDPALQNEDWYKTRTFKPRPTCDVTQYVNDMKKTDKYFRL